jgi:DNA-binding response OmpR family regulator
MTLLIVEDEERVASFLEKGLRGHGYDVEWARCGRDALRRVERPDISFVILDLGLPDLDGFDVLEAREFFLLKTFVAHPRQILSRPELLSMAWGMSFDPGTNLVDVYVGYLRRKLGERVVETVRGAGYRLRIDGPAGTTK